MQISIRRDKDTIIIQDADEVRIMDVGEYLQKLTEGDEYLNSIVNAVVEKVDK